MMPLKVVLLGGTGFVGRALADRLRADGHAVLVPSRNLARHRDRRLAPGVELREGNVHDPAVLRACFAGADAVVNLVGILNERGDDGRGFRRAHVELTRSVIAACEQAGVPRLLQMSALNAGRGDSHYLQSRGEAEALVKASTLAWTIFQSSVIFAPGDGLFARFGGLLRVLPALPLARANCRFAPVYLGDVVAAMAQALVDPNTIGQTYELYGPDTYTLAELVRMTARQMGVHRLVVPLPDAIGRLQALAGDFVPGKTFSSDNYRSLGTDSVGGVDGLARLGIEPTRVAAILPEILGDADDRQARLDHYRATAH